MSVVNFGKNGQLLASSFDGEQLPQYADETHLALGETSVVGERTRKAMALKQKAAALKRKRKFNAIRALAAQNARLKADNAARAQTQRIAQFARLQSAKANLIREGRKQSRLGMDFSGLMGDPFEGFGSEGKTVRSIDLVGEATRESIQESDHFGESTLYRARGKLPSRASVEAMLSRSRSQRTHPMMANRHLHGHPMGFGFFKKIGKAIGSAAKSVGKAAGSVVKTVAKVTVTAAIAPFKLAGEANKLVGKVGGAIIEKTPLKFVDKITGGVISGGLKATEVGGKVVSGDKVTKQELIQGAIGGFKAGAAILTAGTISSLASNLAQTAATNATTGILAKTPIGKTALGGALGAAAGAITGGAGLTETLSTAAKSAVGSEIAKKSSVAGAAFTAYTGKQGDLTSAARAAGATAIGQKSAIAGAAFKTATGGGGALEIAKAAAAAKSPLAAKVFNVIESGKPGAAVEAAQSLGTEKLSQLPAIAQAELLKKATADNARGLAIKAVADKTGIPVNKIEAVAEGKMPSDIGVSASVAKLTTDTVAASQVQALKKLQNATKIPVSKQDIAEVVKDRSETLVGVNADRFKIAIAQNADSSISLKERAENASELAKLEARRVADAKIKQAVKAKEALQDAAELKSLASKVQNAAELLNKQPNALNERNLNDLTAQLQSKMVELNQTGSEAIKAADQTKAIEAAGAVKVAAARQGRYWAGYEFDHPMLQFGYI